MWRVHEMLLIANLDCDALQVLRPLLLLIVWETRRLLMSPVRLELALLAARRPLLMSRGLRWRSFLNQPEN